MAASVNLGTSLDKFPDTCRQKAKLSWDRHLKETKGKKYMANSLAKLAEILSNLPVYYEQDSSRGSKSEIWKTFTAKMNTEKPPSQGFVFDDGYRDVNMELAEPDPQHNCYFRVPFKYEEANVTLADCPVVRGRQYSLSDDSFFYKNDGYFVTSCASTYCAFFGIHVPVMMVAIGEGGDGKGAFDILESSLFGKQNSATLDPAIFVDDNEWRKSAHFGLHKKRVCIKESKTLSANVRINVDVLKRFIAGEEMIARANFGFSSEVRYNKMKKQQSCNYDDVSPIMSIPRSVAAQDLEVRGEEGAPRKSPTESVDRRYLASAVGLATLVIDSKDVDHENGRFLKIASDILENILACPAGAHVYFREILQPTWDALGDTSAIVSTLEPDNLDEHMKVSTRWYIQRLTNQQCDPRPKCVMDISPGAAGSAFTKFVTLAKSCGPLAEYLIQKDTDVNFFGKQQLYALVFPVDTDKMLKLTRSFDIPAPTASPSERWLMGARPEDKDYLLSDEEQEFRQANCSVVCAVADVVDINGLVAHVDSGVDRRQAQIQGGVLELDMKVAFFSLLVVALKQHDQLNVEAEFPLLCNVVSNWDGWKTFVSKYFDVEVAVAKKLLISATSPYGRQSPNPQERPDWLPHLDCLQTEIVNASRFLLEHDVLYQEVAKARPDCSSLHIFLGELECSVLMDMKHLLEEAGAVPISLVYDGIYFRPMGLDVHDENFIAHVSAIEAGHGISLQLKDLSGAPIPWRSAAPEPGDRILGSSSSSRPHEDDFSSVLAAACEKLEGKALEVVHGENMCVISALTNMDLVAGEPSQAGFASGPYSYRQLQKLYPPLKFSEALLSDLICADPMDNFVLHIGAPERIAIQCSLKTVYTATAMGLVKKLTASGHLRDWRGEICPWCGEGELGPLKNFPGRSASYRCRSKRCQKFVLPHHDHPVFSHGRGNASAPFADKVAVCMCATWDVAQSKCHQITGNSHKLIENVYTRLDSARMKYVKKKEKSITFGAIDKWPDVEADEVDLGKRDDAEKDDQDKPVQWEQWGGLVERGRPNTLVLTRLDPCTTKRRAPGPGPIRKRDWKPIAKRHLENREVVLHTDGAKAYKLKIPKVLHDNVVHMKKKVTLRGVARWIKPKYSEVVAHRLPTGEQMYTKSGTQIIDRFWSHLRKHLQSRTHRVGTLAATRRIRSAQWTYWNK
ncbi:unnamed protein product, partial [Prorocentrum cordatum]